MIFFAIFIVNSFLNSGLGYVGLSAGFNLNCSLRISLLSWLLVWSIALLSFFKRNWSWVWEWLWVVKVSRV